MLARYSPSARVAMNERRAHAAGFEAAPTIECVLTNSMESFFPEGEIMPKSRLIVVTGVSQGLGLAMIEGFIERGHVVCGCARSQVAIDELNERLGPTHHFEQVDIAEDLQVERWAASILVDRGVPDLLINNAALMNANNPLWNVPPEEFAALVDVNIKGMFHVIRHFVPAMVARQSGIIVNFSSTWGRSTSPEVAPYCATKWAVEGLTRSLADELPAGMAAVPLNPGIIHTAMLESCFGASAASFPTPQQWSTRAVPYILKLGPHDNGRPAAVPT